MDFHGEFKGYRVDTQKAVDVVGKMDLVVALLTPSLDGSVSNSRQNVWTKTFTGVRYLIDRIAENTYLSFARNMCIHTAKDCAVRNFNRVPDYYLWLDQDNVFPDDIFFQLHKHKVDIVSGSYARKGGAWEWVFRPTQEYRNWEAEGRHGLVECRYIGFGAALIRGEVFEKVAPPWFCEETTKEKRDGKPVFHETGEDVYFCDKAREAGYKVWVDVECHVGHMGATIWPKDAYLIHSAKAKTGDQEFRERGDTKLHLVQERREALS